MKQLIDYMFMGFWNFVGGCIVFTIITDFILKMWNRFFRHWNIRKHGYPPPNCDADGDLKKEKKD